MAGTNPGTNETAVTEMSIIDERTIRSKIDIVRDVQVMPDFELAEIDGYTTSAFNQQAKNNTLTSQSLQALQFDMIIDVLFINAVHNPIQSNTIQLQLLVG